MLCDDKTVLQDMLLDDFGRERSRFLPQMAAFVGLIDHRE